jgi:hypothetical protein
VNRGYEALPVPALRALLLLLVASCAAPPPPAAPTPGPVAPPPLPVALPPAPPPPPPAPPPLSELELTTHRAVFDALRAHDPKALAALYAPDASVEVGVGLVDAKGPDAVVALVEALWAAFPDSKVQWGTLLQSGHEMAVELAWTGTNTGTLGEHAPTKKVLGTALLLLETFTPSGLIQSQRLYFDAETLATDLATRVGPPHAFVGLPTAQTTVLDGAPTTAEDEPAMRTLAESLANGTPKSLAALGSTLTTWFDETRRHTTEGKGAVAAWAFSVSHAFAADTRPVAWTAGDHVALEWSGAEPRGAHAAEVIAFQGGHITSIHTYRASPPKPRK